MFEVLKGIHERVDSSGITELLLSGHDTDPLLKALKESQNPNDDNKPYSVVIHDLLEACKTQALEELTSKHDYRVNDVDRDSFDFFSISFNTRQKRKGQAPYLDCSYGNAEFFVSLSDNCSPPNVILPSKSQTNNLFDSKDTVFPDDKDLVKFLEVAKEPLGLALPSLFKKMVPATSDLMKPGDILSISGPIIRSVPAIAATEDRAVLCFRSTLPGFSSVSLNRIYPWLYHYDKHHDKSYYNAKESMHCFSMACREWGAYKPWESLFKEMKPIKHEVKRLCRGDPIYQLDHFFK